MAFLPRVTCDIGVWSQRGLEPNRGLCSCSPSVRFALEVNTQPEVTRTPSTPSRPSVGAERRHACVLGSAPVGGERGQQGGQGERLSWDAVSVRNDAVKARLSMALSPVAEGRLPRRGAVACTFRRDSSEDCCSHLRDQARCPSFSKEILRCSVRCLL